MALDQVGKFMGPSRRRMGVPRKAELPSWGGEIHIQDPWLPKPSPRTPLQMNAIGWENGTGCLGPAGPAKRPLSLREKIPLFSFSARHELWKPSPMEAEKFSPWPTVPKKTRNRHLARGKEEMLARKENGGVQTAVKFYYAESYASMGEFGATGRSCLKATLQAFQLGPKPEAKAGRRTGTRSVIMRQRSKG